MRTLVAGSGGGGRSCVGGEGVDGIGILTVGGLVLDCRVGSTGAGIGSGGSWPADLELWRCPWAFTKDVVKDTARY